MVKRPSPPVIVAGLAALTLVVLAIAFMQGERADPRGTHTAETVVMNVTTERYAFAPGSAEPINVTKGSLVVLHITSTDVTHGFAIEGYGVNEEIPAGQTVTVTFRASKEGAFTIYCTVFCGSGHPGHKGTLNVVA